MIPEARKHAWVTLSTEPEYLPGAVALARSLRQCHSEHRLIVMVTPASDASMIDVLESEGCEIRTVEPIVIQNSSYAAARYANVWTKLRVWGLEDLTRVIFLDTDMLVLRNMDELFQIELPAGGIAASPACVCNPHHKSTYPKSWVPENCYYTYARAESERSTGVRTAKERDYFNAGLLVFEPNRATLAAFLERLASSDAPDYPFADQDFLNEYFRARWRILPYFFNALKTLRLCHPSLWHIDAVRNIHYILEKPWQAGDAADNPYQDLDLLWRHIYEGATASVLHEAEAASISGRPTCLRNSVY
jgi:alpha-N-acetylglucosamine transferase